MAGRVTKTLRTRDGTHYMAIGAGSLWMPNASNGTVTRIDLATSEVTAVIDVSRDPQSAPFDADPQSVATSGDQIWAGDRGTESVRRIDPATNRIVEMHTRGHSCL